MSLEELMDIQVTLVSKRPEKLTEAASAIQVITQDEIRRSGATTLPEALRLASNLQVAQVDARQWAISARGFNNTLSNKLLVMIDGRTIYTPLYAGVFWDVQHVLLEDIDRIEVVSGPGGTLWGANAVNGVINIVTKDAAATQGALLQAQGGSFLRDFGAGRYGGRIDSTLFFRVYGQRFDHNSTVLHNGDAGKNEWGLTQGGFRMDWRKNPVDAITVQGDLYGGDVQQLTPGRVSVDGQNLQARWTRTLSSESDVEMMVYGDRTSRTIPNLFGEDLNTYNFDFQHRLSIGSRNLAVWGGNYRLMQDDVKNSPGIAFLPAQKDMQLFSGFLQDRISIAKNYKFTLGSKFEHNDYSGFEIQPAVRLAWTPDERRTAWGAVSRAVRAPSRIDVEAFIPAPPVPAGTPSLTAGSDFISETVIAYELGYRLQPIEKLSLSVATFYNRYDDIRSVERVDSTTYQIMNGLEGDSRGVEFSGTWQAARWWRWSGGYTYLERDIWAKAGHQDFNQGRGEGNDPANQYSFLSSLDLPNGFQLNVMSRYVDALPFPSVPDYATLDVNLIWNIPHLEFSLAGNNLGVAHHPEFGPEKGRQEIPRSISAKVTWNP